LIKLVVRFRLATVEEVSEALNIIFSSFLVLKGSLSLIIDELIEDLILLGDSALYLIQFLVIFIILRRRVLFRIAFILFLAIAFCTFVVLLILHLHITTRV